MDSTPNQPQPSSSGRNVQKANEKRIAKREKEQQKLEKFAAVRQAKRHPLRRQEGTGHLDEAFRPLYPEEPEESRT
ncbi:hypothetical protein DdX_14789 [Ditylenchus destructor]|uniref:Uncharacterized protein n=1 Tax=Ditylenchus destructor TaxID=166010 RepID=A0AAD4MRB8_9BILA|nr:hypothetical protein DdX_14789 [Ditylenchus destructor]